MSIRSEFLTPAETAALLKRSTRTVDRARRRGELVAVTRGGGARPRVYYRRADVLAYKRAISEPVAVAADEPVAADMDAS